MRPHMCDQRGSVSPVFLSLLSLCLLLLAVFLDREWANYMMKLAEQTADFAAEAGAKAHQSWADVEMTKRQVRHFSETYCIAWDEEEEELCIDTAERQWTETYWDWVRADIRHEELLRDQSWKERYFQCGESATYPAWECFYAQLVGEEEWLIYTEEAEPLALATFDMNWRPRSAVTVLNRRFDPQAGAKMVRLHATLEIRSLFGMLGWRRNVEIIGAAVTQIPEIELN